MSTITSKITVPIILAGLFSIAVFLALTYTEFTPGFYITLFLLTIYIFFFGFATGQSLASPVNQLLEKAKNLSRGDLSSRVYLKTKDELSELAEIINKLAEELEESHIDSKILEKSVDIKARARTQALEETINALEQKVRNRTAELEKILGESKNLQKEVRIKEAEIAQLKKEVENFKPRIKNQTPKSNARTA